MGEFESKYQGDLFIAQNLEKALESGFYVPMDSCVFCGEKFTKSKGIVMLDEEQFVHLKCFRKERNDRGLDFSDVKDWRRWFPNDAPKFEYSNLESKYNVARQNYLRLSSKEVFRVAGGICFFIGHHDAGVELLTVMKDAIERHIVDD